MARLLKVTGHGEETEVFRSTPKMWGQYLRYTYATFDFTSQTDSGLYIIEYGDRRTAAVKIARDVYENAWHPTLDEFFPVQMDHMRVTEAYRVWHGASHLDDALQAPVNHEHFDLYAQGPVTNTQYKPGEHIPGLNVGGWFDAGDFDIRTQSQYATILSMVQTWEHFHPGSSTSFVSGVGAVSKNVAYGNNRADYSFIAGGVVPGIVIVKPDFPEHKDDWPFLWGENEYVITLAASYLYLVHAANDLLNEHMRGSP